MFGSNYLGAPYFAQGPLISITNIVRTIRSFTRFVKGFNRTTRRVL